MEDVSYKFSDKNLNVPDAIFPKEDNLRREFLYGKGLRTAGATTPLATSSFESTLAKDAFRHQLFGRYAGPSGATLQTAYDSGTFSNVTDDANATSDLTAAANTLYYVAKNMDFRDSNYFNELSRIKVRVDFARSFAFTALIILSFTIAIAGCALILLVVALAVALVAHLLGRSTIAQEALHFDPRQVASLVTKLDKSRLQEIPWSWRLSRFVLVAAVLVGIYLFGRAAFERESEEYYRRAYGYFVTGVNPGVASQPIDEKQNTPLVNVSTAKDQVRDYKTSTRWDADISEVCWEAEQYLRGLPPAKDGEKRAMVFDIDDTALSTWPQIETEDFGYVPSRFDNWVKRADAPANKPVLEVYRLARAKGIATFFITGRRTPLKDPTIENLRAVGYDDWEELILRPVDDRNSSIIPFKSSQRRHIADSGYHIIANIGDQDSDLLGGYADKSFKLPNPAYIIK